MSVSTATQFGTDCVLMLHGDGSDASTTFTDSSPAAKTITAVGNAQIDTAQSKFGGASMLFDGAGDYITAPDSADWDFGTGDFTVDYWIRFASVVNGHYPWNHGSGPMIGSRYSGGMSFIINASNAIIDGTTMTTSTWYHIAFVRSGTTIALYKDGVQLATATNSFNITGASTAFTIGAFNDGSNAHNGWIDEFRVVKGTAIWTSAFTPPSAAYTPVVAGSSGGNTGNSNFCALY